MSRAATILIALMLSATTDATLAQPSGERERIASERAAAKARLAEQERGCREQFIVTACLEAARKEEQSTLARLRRAELVLDDAQRREAAAQRRLSIQQRAAAQAARASTASAASEPGRPDEPRPAPVPHAVAASRPDPAGSASDAPRRATEQRNVAAFEARAHAAQAHRAEVERRRAARAASGKVVAPLPAPSGASAP